MSVHQFTGNVRADGDPPDNGGMEARVAKLETFVAETRDRLARIETKIDSFPSMFATKADLSDLGGAMRTELHKAISDQTWKLVTFVCGFGTALVAATYFVAKLTR